jgi:uncharacterized protein
MHSSIRAHATELSTLCRRHGVRRLELFGSAASDCEAIGDLDFLVEFEGLDPEKYADAYFGLPDELERLFGRSVDLISFLLDLTTTSAPSSISAPRPSKARHLGLRWVCSRATPSS